MTRDVTDRFMEKIDKRPDGCWLWTGTIPKNGYGRFGMAVGRSTSTWAHRASWLLFRGPLPTDRELDHLCRVRHCVNPAHLELVTHLENVQRSVQTRFNGMCRRGLHDLTVDGSRNAAGLCRLCVNAHMRVYGRRWRATKKAKREAAARGEEFLMFLDLA